MDIASPATGDLGYFKKRTSGMTAFVVVDVTHKQYSGRIMSSSRPQNRDLLTLSSPPALGDPGYFKKAKFRDDDICGCGGRL